MRVWTVCLWFCVALSAAVRDVTSLQEEIADSILGEFQVCLLLLELSTNSYRLDRIESD